MKGAGYKVALIWYKDADKSAQIHGSESSIKMALAQLGLDTTFPELVRSEYTLGFIMY